MRLIAVVLGAADSRERYRAAAGLLEQGFERYERITVVRRGEPLQLAIPVRGNSVARIGPVAGDDVSLLRRRGEEHDLQVRYQLPAVLLAPLPQSTPIGELIVEEAGRVVAVVPILSPPEKAVPAILSATDSP
jgi:D-alanyl-D-alanine carboxypeptidase (penicillin-binding protein 5/6)